MDKYRHYETIDKYIDMFPKEVQDTLEKLRRTIKKVAPGAVEAISYGIPTFRLNGNLVHFAAYKSHIGFYPGALAIYEFKRELSTYKTSKGTVQFRIGQAIPFDLIKEIVEFRVKENLKKSKG